MALEPVEIEIGQLVVFRQRDNRHHRRAVLEKVQVTQHASIVAGVLVVIERLAIAIRFDRQQADAFDRLGVLVEMRQVDRAEKEVVDVQPCRFALEDLELFRAGGHRLFGHHRLRIRHCHRPGEAHEQVVGIEADGFTDVDAGAAEIILIVIGGHCLGSENVEDLLRDVLIGVPLHRIDIVIATLAGIIGLGVAHDVVGNQHHRVPRPDALHHAFLAAFLAVEVVGEIPLFGKILAQQTTGIDVQRFGNLDALIGNARQDADAAGEDRLEHERVTAQAVIFLGLERLAHVGILLRQTEFGSHPRAGAATSTEDEEIQPRLVGLDAAGIDQIAVDVLPVGIAEALRILVEDDPPQVLPENRRIAGTTRMDFRQVHDLHLAVGTEQTAIFRLARIADAAFDILVEVTEHHQRLNQEHRSILALGTETQAVANPAARAVLLARAGINGEFVEVELAGVMHQAGDIQRDVRTAAPEANQTD